MKIVVFFGYEANDRYFRPYFEGWANIPDAGVPDRTNANGDSTDRYGNLFLDPRLAGGDDFPDRYFLSEESPCIDAGDPDAPLDPDSTIADIGPFFFAQPNIAVSADSFVFEETFVGDSDTLFFTISNYGDQKTLIYYIREEALSRAFWVYDWGAFVRPGESAELGLVFRPQAAEEYLDTLVITSNDRDEREILLPIRAFGANGVREDEEVGSPGRPALLSVSPNPFNSSTTITFGLDESAPTRLAVFDLSGSLVAELLDRQGRLSYGAGGKITPPAIAGGDRRTVVWEAGEVPAGVYLVRLEAGGEFATRKVVLMR